MRIASAALFAFALALAVGFMVLWRDMPSVDGIPIWVKGVPVLVTGFAVFVLVMAVLTERRQ